MRTRIDPKMAGDVSAELGLSVADVSSVVASFFDVIAKEAKALPFDNPRRIYRRSAFREFAHVRQIPFIGRTGPAYSRYLKWRVNEAKGLSQKSRRRSRRKMTRGEVENIAASILSGRPFSLPERRGSEGSSVWMVGNDGKRLAGQVIMKDKINDKR